MSVYFAREGNDGPVKIGTSRRVLARVRDIASDKRVKMSVIRIIDGGVAEERELHERYRHLHISGEMFHFDQTMLTCAVNGNNIRRSHQFTGLKPRKDQALTEAIERAGGVVALAQRLGITKQAVSSWDRIPADRAHAIADAVDMPLHQLRPDLWLPEHTT